MKAIVLAAGYSTRLHPITDDKPKSLLPIGGKTILDILLDNMLAVDGLDQIVIVVNEKFHSQFEEWHSLLPPGPARDRRIVLLNDGTTSNENRLGAVRDACLAVDMLGFEDDAFVIAGDNYFEGRLQDFVEARRKHDASIVGVYRFPGPEAVRGKFGVVTAGPEGQVTAFEEKPENPKSALAATAVYLFTGDALRKISALQKNDPSGEWNMGGLIQALLAEGERVYTLPLETWFDIGTHEDLAIVRKYVLEK